MRSYILLVVILLSFSVSRTWASTDSTATYKRNFGYGVSNTLQLFNFSTYVPGIYLEFGQRSPIEGLDYNIKLIGLYSLTNQGNVRTHSLVPFMVTLGLEKSWYLEKVIINLNANLFYSMSLRKGTLGPFQGDDYGVGISPGVNLGYPLKENLVVSAGIEYGLGFFREFVSVGTVTTQTMRLNYAPVRSLSLGIRHYF